jgi:hypothetical protein
VARAAHEKSRDPWGVIIATGFAMYLSLPYLSFRPVTLVLVLLALCTWLLLRDRRYDERTRGVWLIVPLTLLMTNCHFFAWLVPAFVAALLAGAVRERRSIRRYALMFCLTFLACLGTPMLPGVVTSIWTYQFSDPMLGGGIITEFQPIWVGEFGWISVVVLIGLIGLMFHNRSRLRAGEVIWFMLTTVLLIRLGRFAPVFAPIAAAIIAACLPRIGGAVLERGAVRAAVAVVLIVGALRIAMAFPRADTPMSEWLNRHGPDTPGYPCDAADFVAQNLHQGRVVNEFTWGGYIAWRLGERFQILLDGRTQLYTPQFWQQMYLGDPNASRALLRDCGASAAIVPIGRSRFRDTLVDLGWQSVWHDERAEVLLPPAPVTELPR